MHRLRRFFAERFQTKSRRQPANPPANDDDAISALVQDENAGLTHLVFPEPAFWWLDHYTGFKSYLAERYDLVPTSSANVLVFHNHQPSANQRCQKTSTGS